MCLLASLFPVVRTPLMPPRPRARRWRRFLSWPAPSRGVPPVLCYPGALLGQRYAHRGPAPADPALGRPLRDPENLCYLRIREALHVPQHQRRPVLRPHMLEGNMYLLAALRAQGRRLGVGVVVGRLRQVRHLVVVLPLLPARLSLAEAQAGVHRDPVQPGGKRALSPEAFYVSPDPDPNLLARILGALGTQHAKRHSIYKTRIVPNEFRERLDVSLGGADDEVPLLDVQRSTSLARQPEMGSLRATITR